MKTNNGAPTALASVPSGAPARRADRGVIYERPVSANEQLYLSMSRTFSHFVIQVVIEGKGAISAKQLEAALQRVSVHFPGTRLTLRRKKWAADAPVPPVSVLSEYPDFGTQLNESIHLYRCFSPEQGRTCEVALARKGDNTLLVFRALHAVMDGQGLRQWAKAVFNGLRGEDIPIADSRLTEDEFLRIRKAPLRRDEPALPRCSGPEPRSHSAEDAYSFDYARRTIRGIIPAITAQLAASMRTLLCADGRETSCVMIPVDLRQVAPNLANSTANLSLPIYVPIGAGEGWLDVSHQLLRQLKEQRYLAIGMFDWLYRLAPPSILAWLSRKDWLRQIKRRKYYSSAVISHIGLQDMDDFRAPDFQPESICFLPCVMPAAPLSFVITEQASRTEVCIVKARPLWNDAGELLDKVLALAGLKTEKLVPSHSEPECIFGLPIQHSETVADISIRINDAAHKYRRQVAIYDDEIEVTYEDFLARRNQIAAVLTDAVGRILEGERIALLMDRSIEAFLCIHACLELNAAFVPIDPNYPPERIEMILADSKPVLLIHDEPLQIHDQGVPSISIRSLWSRCQGASVLRNAATHNPSTLAYIIHTSGTTGRPKGVCVTRNNLSHYVHCAEREFFAAYQHSGVPLVTSLSFDISIPALFAPLLQGCKVKIIRQKALPVALQEVLDDSAMTFGMMTPSHLQMMMGLGQKPASLWKCLAVGGERVSTDLCRKALEFFGPQLEIINVYGPTETTVTVTQYRFDPAADDTEIVAIANRPIECAGVYLLRPDLSPCNVGEEGEIYIGGHTVSKGYWENPAETAARFLPDPFLKQGIMYRSGDRGVYRQGKIYFVGRNDEQIKINGFRIELEEITTRLKRFPGVTNTVVVLDPSGPRALLKAFFTTSLEEAPDPKRLKTFLGDSLPPFMIPSSFHQVDEIPLTINGKVDRECLLAQSGLPATHITAEDDYYEDVGDIWSKHLALSRDQLDMDSNFFHLGGNSILLIEVLHDVDRLICEGKSAPALFAGLKSFLVNPQLAQMVRLVETARCSGGLTG